MSKFISSVWDFAQATIDDTGYATHDFFRWYGKLVPQLVRRIIELYTEPGDRILANFAGSGTVLVEADLLGRHVVGMDSNPLATLVCRAKLLASPPDLSEFYEYHAKELSTSPSVASLMQDAEKWFPQASLEELYRTKRAIDKVTDTKARTFLLVALAAIVRHAARVDERSINHIVLAPEKPERDVHVLFKEKVYEMMDGIREFSDLRPAGLAEVMLGHAGHLPYRNDSFQLVLSHPPYLGAIDYSNIHQLSLRMLGFDYPRTKHADMSATRHAPYVRALGGTLDEALRVCAPGGIICLVIGDNRKDGFIQPTFVDAIEHMRRRSVGIEDIFIWVLSRKAGMNVARRGNHIDHNYILIFRKSVPATRRRAQVKPSV